MPSYTFTNTPPDSVGLPYRTDVAAMATGNVTLTNPPSSVDGVTLLGPIYGGANGSLLFLNSQTDPLQNGIYMFQEDSGAPVTVSGSFSSGSFTLSGLTANKMYVVFVEATVLTIGNGTVTMDVVADSNGERWMVFRASATGTLVFTGPNSGAADPLIDVYPANLVRADTPEGLDYEATDNAIYVLNGTANKAKWFREVSYNPATGLRTYAQLGTPPTGSLLQFSNQPPTPISL